MKRLLLACFLLTATCTSTVVMAQGNNQTVQTPKATFVAKYNQMNQHLLNNQLNLAKQDFEQMKPMFIGNFAAGKSAIYSAPNQATKDALMATNHTKQTIYSDIMNLAMDLAANRVAIKAKFDAFADLY